MHIIEARRRAAKKKKLKKLGKSKSTDTEEEEQEDEMGDDGEFVRYKQNGSIITEIIILVVFIILIIMYLRYFKRMKLSLLEISLHTVRPFRPQGMWIIHCKNDTNLIDSQSEMDYLRLKDSSLLEIIINNSLLSTFE